MQYTLQDLVLNQPNCNKIIKENSVSNLTQNQMCKLLDMLTNRNDINSLLKLFTTLGLHLLSDNKYRAMIVKFNPLYEKIQTVLNKGIQSKTKLALNLISALMYSNLEEGYTSLIADRLYAQNMIRSSGCLFLMNNFFTSSMMQRETWAALCQSLSVVCSGSALNQNYCSHLIPLCVRRCRQGDFDVLCVLRSLLNQHERNLALFYGNDGMSIFSRENLRYPEYLELLNHIVDNCTKVEHSEIIAKFDGIFRHLRHMAVLNDNKSPIVHWASVILYTYKKRIKKNNNDETLQSNQLCNIENNPSNNNQSETAILFNNILKEVHIERQSQSNVNPRVQDSKKKQYSHLKKANTNSFLNNCEGFRNNWNGDKKLSFSFLLKHNEIKPCYINTDNSTRKIDTIIKDNDEADKYYQYQNTDTSANNTCTITNENQNESFVEFQPTVVSTPKRNNAFICSVTKNDSRIQKKQETKHRKMGTSKNISTLSHNKNRSIGARFFDIINGSCSTIVQGIKGIKNVFKRKPSNKNPDNSDKSITKTCRECSYSFTNYMRRRDALTEQWKRNYDFSVNKSTNISDYLNSCKTCNDTGLLRQKLIDDPELKETIRRLKTGINLYGCDFKKISRLFWARESYMTPDVLYSLYRKLIVK